MSNLKTKKKFEHWTGDYGPHLYGATLHIDEAPLNLDPSLPISFDVETDEKDAFVGVGVCQSPSDVYYFSKMSDPVHTILNRFNLVGHGARLDIRMVQKWGFKTSLDQLIHDTKISSYVCNSTAPSHGLKDLAKHHLNMVWPAYKQMIHPNGSMRKVTLDQQEVERVARYCGMDALGTWLLYRHFESQMTVKEKDYLNNLEMPIYRLLHLMEEKGVHIDVQYLKELDQSYAERETLCRDTFEKLAPGVNPASPVQLLTFLRKRGLELESTSSKDLEIYKQDDVIKALLDYREISKLRKTYTAGLLELNSDRVHTQYNQVTPDGHGISTGRLSSQGPNLQNIPTRKETGKQLRNVFTAKPGYKLLVFDYSQIEPRLAAHFSKDEFLIESFRKGESPYENLIKGTDRKKDDAKTFLLAKLYGAQIDKLAYAFKCAVDEAEQISNSLSKKIPRLESWITRVKYEATKNQGIVTLAERHIPIDKIKSRNKFERWGAERKAVNYTIQGSAAEIIKKAMLRIYRELSLVPVLQVHDELVFELTEDEIKQYMDRIKNIMTSCVKLDVPLEVKGGIGQTWGQAK